MALIEDLCASFAASGFKRIVFLNGHYDNTYAIAYACANAAEKMPKDVKAFPVNYWDGLTADEVAELSGLKNGLARERRRDVRGPRDQPGPGGHGSRERGVSAVPGVHGEHGPVHTAFFFTSPGSVHWATKSGTWGDARKSTPEMGERYIAAGVRSTLAVLDNIEKTFAAMPPR